jgi:RNA polymerase sigma factor (sigma-70 family)
MEDARVGLTKKQREAAALKEIEFELTKPHTQEEIAAFLGVSQKTVSVIEARALKKLKELADADWGDDISRMPEDSHAGIKFR